MKLSLKLKKSEPIEIENAKGDAVELYELVELTGVERDEYINLTATRVKFVGGKAAGLTDYRGIQIELVHQSLRDSEGKKVNKEVLKQWPASVIRALSEQAQKLSGLEQEQKELEESAKND